jgi:AcrR family transcriptional regulator
MPHMASRRRYAKGVATREEILDVAYQLFVRKGYDRTSVREIARSTGLSQGALLHHFSSKEELFVEVLRRRDRRNREGYRSSDGADRSREVEDISVGGLLSVVDHNAQEPGLVRLYVAMSAEGTDVGSPARSFFEERYQWLRTEVAADVRRQQEGGEVSKDLDPDAIASLLIAAADGLQIQWLLDPDALDMGARLAELWAALRRVP